MAQFIITVLLLGGSLIGLVYLIGLHKNPVLFLKIDLFLQIAVLGSIFLCIAIGYGLQFPLFNIFAGLLLLGLGVEQYLVSNLICMRFEEINSKLKVWRQTYAVVGLFMSAFSMYVFIESADKAFAQKNLYLFVFALLLIGFFYALVTKQDLAQRSNKS